jgi:hypothetical protein
VIEDHGAVASTGVGELLGLSACDGEAGLLVKDIGKVGVPGGLVGLAGGEMAVDEAEGGVVDDQAADDGAL